MLKTIFFGESDTGLVRKNNEDAFMVNASLGIGVLADGMGGAAAGELASQMFVEAVAEVFAENGPGRNQDADYLVRKSFELGNRKLLDHAIENPQHRGLGCTAELMVVSGRSFALGHVGDSRTYLLRNAELSQLTKDHSFVQELMDKGVITAAEARQHRMRHVILRAVGQSETLEIDIVKGDVSPGDIFLLCSDGLTDMVDDAQIERVLASVGELPEKARWLIDAAEAAGGLDNISVVLCQVFEHEQLVETQFDPPR